jgi:hypothetical protein
MTDRCDEPDVARQAGALGCAAAAAAAVLGSMRTQRFRVTASANSCEKLPTGDAPSFDVLDPPAHYVARYEGQVLDVPQLDEARQAIAAAGYRVDAGQRAWVKAQRRVRPEA